MNFKIKIISLFLVCVLLYACNNNSNNSKRDELRAKSTAVDDIIARSGNAVGVTREDRFIDAENRLRTGGGLFGKKATSLDDLFNRGSKKQTASVGLPINAILWKSSLETISFMPLASADPFGGIIITDWYSPSSSAAKNERCKINIFIKGTELKTNNLKVNTFCQSLNENNIWVDLPSSTEDNIKIENAILNKAKKLKLSTN